MQQCLHVCTDLNKWDILYTPINQPANAQMKANSVIVPVTHDQMVVK